jgi:hypothetical protein
MHMKEAMYLRKEFSAKNGWAKQSARDLITRLVRFVYASNLRHRIYAVCCTLNLDDYRRAVRDGYSFKRPHALCAALCVEKVLALQYLQSVDFFFDQNEPFLGYAQALWKRLAGLEGSETTWGIIGQMSAVNMRIHPPLQLADMLAWSRNRSIAVGGYPDLCKAILVATDSSEWDMDYAVLTKPQRRIVLLG